MNGNNGTKDQKTDKMNSINDENLYRLCKRYGEMTLKWRRKFAGLLPEVNRRRLFEKKGFSSIFVFAKKLAGLSEEQVKRVLSLNEKFEDKPILKKMLIEGKESVNKLARIASISTSENEEFLARQVKLLPQSALETLVRDIKFGEKQNSAESNLQKNCDWDSLFEPETDHDKFVRAHKTQALNLSEEVIAKLSELQQKGIDINSLILEFLNKRNSEIEEKKKKISKEIQGKINAGARKEQSLKTTKISINHKPQIITTTQTAVSRYIPVQIKKIINQEYGTKCSISNCQKPATNLHHTQRFSLSKTHDPHFIAPLCHEHHLIAHSIDKNFHKKRNY